MTQFTISGQSHIIDDVLEHLKNGCMGLGIARAWNFEVVTSNKLIFTLKDGEKLNPTDLFWFGYFTKD